MTVTKFPSTHTDRRSAACRTRGRSLRDGLRPYASYAESFEPLQGTNFFGEPFKPESGRQYEIGVRYQPPGWNAAVLLSAFDLRRQNVQTIDPSEPLNQIQTGEVRSRGIELEAVANFDSGTDLIAAYTYLHTEIIESNDGNEGKEFPSAPEHQVSVFGEYTLVVNAKCMVATAQPWTRR